MDEQFYLMRKPVELQFHKGGNDIGIVNPHGFSGQR